MTRRAHSIAVDKLVEEMGGFRGVEAGKSLEEMLTAVAELPGHSIQRYENRVYLDYIWLQTQTISILVAVTRVYAEGKGEDTMSNLRAWDRLRGVLPSEGEGELDAHASQRV